MLQKTKDHGIGLLELMLSLAIIAAVILLATRYFTQASEASKVTQSAQMIRTLIKASYTWMEGQPSGNFSDINLDELVTKNILPKDWKDKTDPWGGKIDLQSFGKNNQIQITLPGPTQTACESLNDIMKNQGVKDHPCKAAPGQQGYIAIYPAEDPYPNNN